MKLVQARNLKKFTNLVISFLYVHNIMTYDLRIIYCILIYSIKLFNETGGETTELPFFFKNVMFLSSPEKNT